MTSSALLTNQPHGLVVFALFLIKNNPMALLPGDQAPEFTLIDTELKPLSLHELRGRKVLILFFPLAFTRVCTAELCEVRDHWDRYQALDAEVLGISVDSLFSLKKFKEEEQLNFTLLSDFNKTTAAAYGALYEDYFGMKGVAKRSAFVINREGNISYAEVHDNDSVMPDFETIRQNLSELA